MLLRPWSEETEGHELAACDIGLAPLFDGPWERGKCGFKAVQCMASGIPVLAANVGVLPSIVLHGETGFLYRDGAEFLHFAHRLASDSELRKKMGLAARMRAATCHSIHSWVDALADILREAARCRNRSYH
jgi:glycosyltransferase involved in cell wall biosynthesis